MSKIYTDLDSILDTRHAMLYYLSSEIAVNSLEDGSYRNRVKDNFGNISSDIFNTLYRKRTKELLNLATPNSIPSIISDLFIENLIDVSEEGKHILYLNIYPYKFNLEEQRNLLTMMESLIPDFTGVQILNLDISELEPKWVKENINHMVMYNGMEWIEYHTSNYKLIETPVLDVEMMSPAISNGRIKESKIDNELFKNLSIGLGGFIKFIPIDIKFFNTLLDQEKK